MVVAKSRRLAGPVGGRRARIPPRWEPLRASASRRDGVLGPPSPALACDAGWSPQAKGTSRASQTSKAAQTGRGVLHVLQRGDPPSSSWRGWTGEQTARDARGVEMAPARPRTPCRTGSGPWALAATSRPFRPASRCFHSSTTPARPATVGLRSRAAAQTVAGLWLHPNEASATPALDWPDWPVGSGQERGHRPAYLFAAMPVVPLRGDPVHAIGPSGPGSSAQGPGPATAGGSWRRAGLLADADRADKGAPAVLPRPPAARRPELQRWAGSRAAGCRAPVAPPAPRAPKFVPDDMVSPTPPRQDASDAREREPELPRRSPAGLPCRRGMAAVRHAGLALARFHSHLRHRNYESSGGRPTTPRVPRPPSSVRAQRGPCVRPPRSDATRRGQPLFRCSISRLAAVVIAGRVSACRCRLSCLTPGDPFPCRHGSLGWPLRARSRPSCPSGISSSLLADLDPCPLPVAQGGCSDSDSPQACEARSGPSPQAAYFGGTHLVDPESPPIGSIHYLLRASGEPIRIPVPLREHIPSPSLFVSAVEALSLFLAPGLLLVSVRPCSVRTSCLPPSKREKDRIRCRSWVLEGSLSAPNSPIDA